MLKSKLIFRWNFFRLNKITKKGGAFISRLCFSSFLSHSTFHSLYTLQYLNLTGLLTVSVGEETVADIAKKTVSSSANVDDIVLLEIDIKDPVKRSPVSGSTIYEPSVSQFVIRHGDDSREVWHNYTTSVKFLYRG